MREGKKGVGFGNGLLEVSHSIMPAAKMARDN